jgi:hypothetical protein
MAWLRRCGVETQAQASGAALFYGCCTFALSCTIARGVLSTAFCIGVILRAARAGA